jgi:hypothetical protein
VTGLQLKLDGIFYDDNVEYWQDEGAARGSSSTRDAAALSMTNGRTVMGGIHHNYDTMCNNGFLFQHATAIDSSNTPNIYTKSPNICRQSAEGAFEALKAKLEVKGNVQTCRTPAHISCSQAEIAEELRIYEQLTGLPPPPDVMLPADITPPPERVYHERANLKGNAVAWQRDVDEWLNVEEAPTPSQLLGFDIAEV